MTPGQEKPILVEPLEAKAPARQGRELLLAWAQNRKTKKPRYILELTDADVGKRCDCECPGCLNPVEAVKPGRLPRTRNERHPHFRHAKGVERGECLIVAARLAALETLQRDGVLDLPRRRRSKSIEGLSGCFHHAWVEAPPEKVHIRKYDFVDQTRALLTLDDGRVLRVILKGTGETPPDDAGGDGSIATVVMAVDDPNIAGMPADEIRSRLRLDPDGACWRSHWKDQELDDEAAEAAKAIAADELDWVDADDLPEGLSPADLRETLLHRAVKAIIEQAGRIALPGVSFDKEVRLSDGHLFRAKQTLEPEEALVESVVLEQRLGHVVPDVMAMRAAPAAHPVLLIEVTVTNRITAERIARIRQENVPALEIDISRMGGRVTRTEFERLVLQEIAGKTWLYHPAEEDFQAAVEAERIEREKLIASRRAVMAASPDELAAQFLRQVEAQARCRAAIPEGEDRTPALELLERVRESADKLALRGFPEALSTELYGFPSSILERLLSIKLDTCIGYRMDTAWNVINTVTCEKALGALEWHSLYLIAIAVYRPTLTKEQQVKVDNWLGEVRQSLKAGEPTYQRPTRYDSLLELLFPDMAAGLRKAGATKRYQQNAAASEPLAHDVEVVYSWRAFFPRREVVQQAQGRLAERAGREIEEICWVVDEVTKRSHLQGINPHAVAARWAKDLSVTPQEIIDYLLDAQILIAYPKKIRDKGAGS